MIDMRFRPLPKWPEKTPLSGQSSRFRTSYIKILDKLEYELNALRASHIFLEAGFDLQQLRNDGWPYNAMTPKHPGVILYFKSKDGDLRFPCGTYNDWNDNLYAIALTLENLRAIDRYGVTLGHQQYLGFKSLAAPAQSLEDHARFLSEHGNPHPGDERPVPISQIIADAKIYRATYRDAARRLHPDSPGSNPGNWDKLQVAKAMLDQHHGLVKEETNAR